MFIEEIPNDDLENGYATLPNLARHRRWTVREMRKIGYGREKIIHPGWSSSPAPLANWLGSGGGRVWRENAIRKILHARPTGCGATEENQQRRVRRLWSVTGTRPPRHRFADVASVDVADRALQIFTFVISASAWRCANR